MSTVLSADGTSIAFERVGQGPALILVDGALCSRDFGPMPKLVPLLAPHFTVFLYDRRGRGGSGDTKPYAKAREVEDLAALIDQAGGSAFVLGVSSGAALALEAAASRLGIAKLAVYEPPFMVDPAVAARHRTADHEAALHRMIAAGRRGDAVKHFLREMVGIPSVFVLAMRLMRGMWTKLEAAAHTLPYDAAVMGDWGLPKARLASITTPTLVLAGAKTDRRLLAAAEAAANVLPNVRHRTLKGQTHNVKPGVLAPAVTDFFRN